MCLSKTGFKFIFTMKGNQHGNWLRQQSPTPTRTVLYLPLTYSMTWEVEKWDKTERVHGAIPGERHGVWASLWEFALYPGVGNLVFQENMAPFNAVEEVINPRHTSQCPGKTESTWAAPCPKIQWYLDRWLTLRRKPESSPRATKYFTNYSALLT